MPENKTLFRDKRVVDAFEQAAAQDWFLPLEITQLSTGNYQGHVRTIKHPDVSVTFESQNCTVHKRAVMTEGLCTVSFVRNNNYQQRFSQYRPNDNSLFLLPSRTEFDIHLIENSNTVYFMLDQSSLFHKLRATNPLQWDKEYDDLLMLDLIDRRSLDVLAELLLLSTNTLTSDSEVGRHNNPQLGTIIIDQIVMAMNASMVPAGKQKQLGNMNLDRARGVVSRCIDYVLAEFQQHKCPSIVDICLEFKISQRTLQYSFQKILGITPIVYLRCLRLNRVRYELLNPESEYVTVTDIATHWHFLHLSKFSSDYNRMFGELPSKTLSRMRGILKNH